MREKKIKEAVLLGAQLLIENGLGDWKIDLNKGRKSLADTYHKDKRISFSRSFITVATKEQFVGVTLHEIAHAMLGPGYGHGKEFVELCTKISPNPDYATHSADVRIGMYIYECPNCNYGGASNKRLEAYCQECFEKQQYHKLVRTKNELLVKEW